MLVHFHMGHGVISLVLDCIIRLQSSDLILPLLFVKILFPFLCLSSVSSSHVMLYGKILLSLHSSSLTFKLLSMVSYGGELVLDSSSTWSGVSNHLSSFSFLLPLIFKKRRTLVMKKIQGIQALHGATLCASAFATKVTTFHSSTSILEGWQWWSTYFLFLFKLMFFIMTNGEKLE